MTSVIQVMPISVRLSKDSERRLDELVRRGDYQDRSEAIRAGLELLERSLEAEETDKVIVELTRADLERLRRAKVFR
jgi:Arc/MetJ-type ribon-helix-helix transcriptional regulator